MLEYLPYETQQQSIVKYLWSYLDLYELQIIIEVIKLEDEYFNIETASTRGLTFIAQLNGMFSLFWKESWTTEQKRNVLRNYKKIMTERGNRELVQYLFDLFQLEAKLTQSTGWILDQSEFTVTFEGSIFDYIVKIPAKYATGTTEREQIEHIMKTFIPVFIDVNIVIV